MGNFAHCPIRPFAWVEMVNGKSIEYHIRIISFEVMPSLVCDELPLEQVGYSQETLPHQNDKRNVSEKYLDTSGRSLEVSRSRTLAGPSFVLPSVSPEGFSHQGEKASERPYKNQEALKKGKSVRTR